MYEYVFHIVTDVFRFPEVIPFYPSLAFPLGGEFCGLDSSGSEQGPVAAL
jgi:hypothetical protein